MRGMIAVGLLVTLWAASASAQKGPFGLGQDLRLDGIVDPSAAVKQQVLGTIKIRAGKTVRKFGVIGAQTARTEGMSLFNRSDLHPEQLLLRAQKSMLDVFRHASAGTRLQMLGRYVGDDYILASITPVDSAATPGSTPQSP
jgi:hypothetical protein